MAMHLTFFNSKRISSYVFVETFLCILFTLTLFITMFNWIIVQSSQQKNYRNQQTSLNNINFLFSTIQEDLLYANWNTNDFLPNNLCSSSSLCFMSFDNITLTRFYQSGKEVGKDINMTTYNAITEKTIKSFIVTRKDLNDYFSLSISITDIYGNFTNKVFTNKKRS